MFSFTGKGILDGLPCPICGNEIEKARCPECGRRFKLKGREKSLLTSSVGEAWFGRPNGSRETERLKRRLEDLEEATLESKKPADFFANYENLLKGHEILNDSLVEIGLDPTDDVRRIRNGLSKAEIDLIRKNLQEVEDEHDEEVFYFKFVPFLSKMEHAPLSKLNRIFFEYGFVHDFASESKRMNGIPAIWRLPVPNVEERIRESERKRREEYRKAREERERTERELRERTFREEEERRREEENAVEEFARREAGRRMILAEERERIRREEEEARKARREEEARVHTEREERRREADERKKAELRRKVFGDETDESEGSPDGETISCEEFLKRWKELRGMETSGCYVIRTYEKSGNGIEDECKATYVGQSRQVFHRVRNHLTGHGNGNVYCDVKNGEDVRIRIVACEESEMNDLERRLIDVFESYRSYNATVGGSKNVVADSETLRKPLSEKVDLPEETLDEMSTLRPPTSKTATTSSTKPVSKLRRVPRVSTGKGTTEPTESTKPKESSIENFDGSSPYESQRPTDDRPSASEALSPESFLTRCLELHTAGKILEEAKRRSRFDEYFLPSAVMERLEEIAEAEKGRNGENGKEEALDVLFEYFSGLYGETTAESFLLECLRTSTAEEVLEKVEGLGGQASELFEAEGLENARELVRIERLYGNQKERAVEVLRVNAKKKPAGETQNP